MTARALALKYLPPSTLNQLRHVKSYLAVGFFRPYLATHTYAGSISTLHITDQVGKQWYDHDWEELPEHTLLKDTQTPTWSQGVRPGSTPRRGPH